MTSSNATADRSSEKHQKLSRHLSTYPRALGLLAAGLAGLVVGCGSPPPSTACDFSQTSGSITVHICIEFFDLTPSQIDEADSACLAQNAPPLITEVVDRCSTDDILGICELDLDGMAAEEIFYESAAVTAASAEAQCDQQGGTWNPS